MGATVSASFVPAAWIATIVFLAMVPATSPHAQGLPPSLPLAQPFGVPEAQGGASNSAVQFSLPLRSLWHSITAADAPADAVETPPPQPARVSLQTNWSLAAHVSRSVAQARTGTTSVSAPLMGSAGILRNAPQVGGDDPFSTIDYRRTPAQSLGLQVSYGVTDRAGRGVSLSGSLGVASFTTSERPRAPVGTTSLKFSF